MLQAIRKRVDEDQQGFTLIELLVVVIIIGILAAIAIPVFLNQRERAWERAVMSDMRNASVVLEEIFSADGSYAAVNEVEIEGDGTAKVLTDADDLEYTLTVSNDVTLSFTGDAQGYTVAGTHANLPEDGWTLDSTIGTVQKDDAAE